MVGRIALAALSVGLVALMVLLRPGAPGSPQASAFWQVAASLPGSAPSIAVAPDGVILMLHYGPEEPAGAQLRLGTWLGDAWSMEVIDGPEDIGRTTAIALASDGTPHVAYDYPRFGIRYARPDRGTWDRIKVEASNPSGTDVSLAMAPDDRPHVGFYEADPEDFAQGRWDPSREEFGLRTISIGDVGSHNDLAVGSDGAYQFVYQDNTARAIYYERDAPERANEIVLRSTTIDSRLALALDPDDRPYIVVPTDDGPVVATRVDDEWQTENISSGSSAAHVSIAVDDEGTAHVVWVTAGGNPRYAQEGPNGWVSEPLPGDIDGALDVTITSEGKLYVAGETSGGDIQILEALAEPPATSTPTRTPTAEPTAGPSPTRAPAAVTLSLSAGCNTTYAPNTILYARFTSTVDGELRVAHQGATGRPLFAGRVSAGEPSGAPLMVTGEPGDRVLIAELDDGAARAECRYRVSAP